MYEIVSNIKDVEQMADDFVMKNDRSLFIPFFTAIEEYCSDNGIIFGGRVSNHISLGLPIDRDFFMWELFAADVDKTGRQIADLIFKTKSPHLPTSTTVMQTIFQHNETGVSINARRIVQINRLDQYRNVDLVTVMSPASFPGIFTQKPCLCFPAEMKLINIYRNFYNPTKCDQYAEDLAIESQYFATFSNKSGGRPDRMHPQHNHSQTRAADVNKYRATEILLRALGTHPSFVVIGDYALQCISDQFASNSRSLQRLQFIASIDIEDAVELCRRALVADQKIDRMLSAGVKLTSVRYNTNIPSDFQITKYSIYIADKSDQVFLADVYNSGTFELVPYWNQKLNLKTCGFNVDHGTDETIDIKIGNPWVLMRLMLVDIWLMKLIAAMSNQQPHQRSAQLAASIEKLRAHTLNIAATDPFKVFQLDNYIGTNISEIIAKRRRIKGKQTYIEPYYPAANASE